MKTSARTSFSRWRMFAMTGILFAALGCSSVFGPDGPELSLSLSTETGVEGIGSFRVEVGGESFEPVETGASREVRAPRDGRLQVRAVVFDEADEALASVEFEQDFRERHSHWVSGRVGLTRPTFFCVGTVRAAPLEVRGESQVPDTLFVMYGSLPEGAVC